MQDVGKVVAESLGTSQSLGLGSKVMKAYVDTGPLVHHVRTHSKNNTVQVPGLGGIAEDFNPGGLFFAALGFNRV